MQTKILSADKTKLHADVLFGVKPMQVVTKRLPESQKWFIQRHNEELKQKSKVSELKSTYRVVEQAKASKRAKVVHFSEKY